MKNNDQKHAQAAYYEPLVGAEEAAKFLHYSASTVIKMARRGEIPAVKFGVGRTRHTWRFYISALDEFLRAKIAGGGWPVISAQEREAKPRPPRRD